MTLRKPVGLWHICDLAVRDGFFKKCSIGFYLEYVEAEFFKEGDFEIDC